MKYSVSSLSSGIRRSHVLRLCLQIVKDDWGSSASSAIAPVPSSVARTPKQQSNLIYGFNKPAAAVAPYQQTPPRPDPSKPPTAAPVIEKPEDDFNFASNSTLTVQSKPAVKADTPGINIARMYKAAGFTSPPKIGVRSSSGLLNLAAKRSSFETLRLSSSFTSSPKPSS